MLQAASEFGYPTGMKYRASKATKDDESLIAWLSSEVRPLVAEILAADCRIPEEVLGPNELRTIWPV